MIRLLLIVLTLMSGVVEAYDFDNASIKIPEGFEGPNTQNMGPSASSTAFTYPHASNGGTLLQISTWDPGQAFPSMSIEELKASSEKYLLQFLQGIERRRENFTRQPTEFITISGHPTAKVAWNGKIQGREVHGVMYCLILNSKIFNFHTQDYSSYGGKYTALAINAIESITFKEVQ